MKICIIGTGYVGLVSGVCFSDLGFYTTCIDKDVEKINCLNSGVSTIYEPGLSSLIQVNREKGRLKFTSNSKLAIIQADVLFVAVGTPSGINGKPDISYVYRVIEEIAPLLSSSSYKVIVIKSTVPVGTTRQLKQKIFSLRPEADFDIVSNPEFLREGSAIKDFMIPDRVIIGVESNRATEIMQELYKPICSDKIPTVYTNFETAELTKYASNAFLATKIAFINEIADICEQCGGDIQDVSKGMGLDQRIGTNFLDAGPGYGGSCFPKDTLALIDTACNYNTQTKIVKAAVSANTKRKKDMAYKIIKLCNGSVKDKLIAVLGITFKANTDDVRDSPSLDIIAVLQNAGAQIQLYDPQGMKHAHKLLKNVSYKSSPYKTVKGANALVILTEWKEFRELDLKRIKSLLKEPKIADLRNIYPIQKISEHEFEYISIGRPSISRT